MIETKIAIALASYNGEKYIEKQISSIQANHYKNWKLIIGDDGSQDKTISIIKKFQAEDSRIVLLESETDSPLGHCQNFNRILISIFKQGFEFFMLADQDDLWNPEKMNLQLDQLVNHSSPRLIHSDLEIIDSEANQKEKSYINFHNFDVVSGQTVHYLLMENCITGCTIMGNRKLLKLALPFPESLHNHDWWLALIASSAGSIKIIDQTLTRYRRHSNNQIGNQSLKEIFIDPESQIREKLIKHTVQFRDQLNTIQILVDRLKHDSSCSKSVRTLEKFINLCSTEEQVMIKVIKLYKEGFRTHHFARWILLINNLKKFNQTINSSS